MTIRFKIAAAALGLVLATGLASAQTGTITQAAPAAQTQTNTGVKTPVKAAATKTTATTVTGAHKTHRVHLSQSKAKHTKIVRRSLRSKLVQRAGVKAIVKAPIAKKHLAKSRLIGTQKHAAIAKTTIIR